MNIKKMKLALGVLEDIQNDKLKVKKFDLDSWGILPPKKDQKKSPSLKCAFAACAIGSIALSGRVPGLTWDIQDKVEAFDNPNKPVKITPIAKGTIEGDEDSEYYDQPYREGHAVRHVFDIDEDMVEFLFMPHTYPVTKGDDALDMVIARMKTVIGAHEARVEIPTSTF